VVASAGLFWFLYAQLSAHGFDWKLAVRSFGQLHGTWLALSLLPIAGTYAVRALRWQIFLKPLKSHSSFTRIFRATLIGFAAISLFGRPGEFVRPYLIARNEGVPATSQFAAWLLERIFDLLMALLVFAYALSRVQASEIQLGPQLTWVLKTGGRIVLLASLAILFVLLSMRHFAEPLRKMLLGWLGFLPERPWAKAERWITAFVQGVESTRSDGALVGIFLYSVLEWILVAACYWCLALAFSGLVHLSLVDVLIFMGFVSFGSAVQIPGIGGGVQVVAVLVLTELFGVRLELATTYALLIWLITFVVVSPVGFILALKEGLNWRSLRHLGEEAAAR
jgi:uncharacterized protein (TIRG00374 family)